MGNLAENPERGDEGFEREALPEVERWNVAREFGNVVAWQVSHPEEARLLANWDAGALTVSPGRVDEVQVTRLLQRLWLPVRRPRRGRW